MAKKTTKAAAKKTTAKTTTTKPAPEQTAEVAATPQAEALAKKEGVDLSAVEGQGQDGQVLVGDVRAAVEQQEAEGTTEGTAEGDGTGDALPEAEASETPAERTAPATGSGATTDSAQVEEDGTAELTAPPPTPPETDEPETDEPAKPQKRYLARLNTRKAMAVEIPGQNPTVRLTRQARSISAEQRQALLDATKEGGELAKFTPDDFHFEAQQ
jgi:pyruvate/2-oxoglutarate dehydrogenase complex dihydrolipoamide acyltransferase (E2) component